MSRVVLRVLTRVVPRVLTRVLELELVDNFTDPAFASSTNLVPKLISTAKHSDWVETVNFNCSFLEQFYWFKH